MLDNGEIVHADTPLTDEQENTLFELVVAFSQIGYDRIDLLPEGFGYDDFEDVFGFEPSEVIENPEYVDLYYYTSQLVDLSGMLAENFDRLIFVETYAGHDFSTDDFALLGDEDGDMWQLTVTDPLTQVSLPIAEAVEGFYDIHGQETSAGVTLYDLSYEGVSGGTSYTLYFKNIVGTYTTSIDSVRVGSFSAYIGLTFA
jgi:hypothetical protein